MAEEPDMNTSAPQNRMRPVHPGEILREDYLKPLGLSANALAQALKVRRGITVDTALRLARYFGGDVQSWMNLQTAYEIKMAEQALAKKIKDEVQPLAA